ncbi:glycosyltransferase family 4 protein [Phreatobacter oligotrophus]|uniref:Glycosyltransferase involved in cell wall biosynthesis n=1 Tax=Phreatobacter oligotrophus TaxID=1122261 RepID=A0A2T4ZGE8_9HYPH|nr:glycosyltransferase family 4 protein [Phreatobacter oligotrophus]PTM60966.1 glycosyltransferase involved in cell wall biosynthesis [Phreatobacter oligotrophus]
MKIALVSDWFVPRLGGIELQMRDLALALMARGHEVRVICGVPGEPEVDGIPVERLPGFRLPGFGIAVTPDVFAALRAAIDGGGYDVVHVHCGNVAPIAHHAVQHCIRRRIPAVATFHSVLKYYDLPLLLLDALHGYARSAVRFTAVSTVAGAALRPLLKDRVVAAIPNGIDLAWWRRPADDRPIRDTVEFVSVTRLQKRKRARWLVRAFAEAVKDLPPTAARLTIVGDGDERRAIAGIIARAGMADRIILAGREERDAIRDRLHAADLFLLASRLEAFGIAALEARAAGLPVVTMAQSGARDFLVEGHDALLVEDDAALAAAIRRLVVEPDLRQSLVRASITPPAGVDWADVAPRYEDEYRAAMAAVA